MREIKFRAIKDMVREWVYGYYYALDRGGHTMDINVMLSIADGNTYPINPKTLGQFTCLKDKNGKEIFEGDLIRWLWDEQTPGPVVLVKFGTLKEDENEGERTGWIVEDCFVDDKCEVVGNIYENPELLDGADKGG